MSQIVPEGEAVRNAVKWISGKCKEEQDWKKIGLLICEAAARFNLSPRDEEFLRVFYSKDKTGEI